MSREAAPDWAQDPLAFLETLGKAPSDAFDPGEAALAFAALDRPKTALGRYAAHLDSLASDVAAIPAMSAQERAMALAQVLHGVHGYAGDQLTYDDLQNANLIRVIDRKKGLPVALGILYLSIARRLGWSLSGLNFPGHFLLSLTVQDQRLPLDPFNGGEVLDAASMRRLLKTMQGEDAELTAACYQPVSDQSVVLRLQNNIKLRLIRHGDLPNALACAKAMSAFAPTATELWREIAMMQMRLENYREAIAGFERYLEAEPNATLRHKVAALLQDVKSKLN